MSFNQDWDLDKQREDHESDEHWLLRKAFMEKWKDNYPEERLVCLARVFANIEFMGCRYPNEVMLEVSKLSQEVAKTYRNQKKTKLQRTFVSASNAAEDRAKGIKREGGIIKDAPPNKKGISFVKQGDSNLLEESVNFKNQGDNLLEETDEICQSPEKVLEKEGRIELKSSKEAVNEYLNDMLKINCIDIRSFRESMFDTCFGRFVLLIRPWTGKLGNLQASCQACNIPIQFNYDQAGFSITINGQVLAAAPGSKAEAKSKAEELAWNIVKEKSISILIKEQWIMQDNARITMDDVSGRPGRDVFGTPIENTVATKMMKMMGWKGGGLGAEAQGIAEPIKPHLQMVNRAGLGSISSDIKQLKRSAQALMRRYIATPSLDVDLVFSADFSKEERAALHQCAQRSGLISRSYGSDADRFLVVKKKLNPFSLVKAVIENGGVTPKYQVFIPRSLSWNKR